MRNHQKESRFDCRKSKRFERSQDVTRCQGLSKEYKGQKPVEMIEESCKCSFTGVLGAAYS